MTTRAMWPYVVMASGCTLVVSALVWTLTLHVTPLLFTLSASVVAWAVFLRQRPHLGTIMFREVVIGAFALAAWWAINHLHL